MSKQASLTECNRLYRRFERLRDASEPVSDTTRSKDRDTRPKGTLRLGDISPEVKRNLHQKGKPLRGRGRL